MQSKGYHSGEHFTLFTEMVQLGSGAFRRVETYRLSGLACLVIAQNADKKSRLLSWRRSIIQIRVVLEIL